MINNIPSRYRGLITIAQLPKNNPQSFDFDKYDLTPVDHDYYGQFQIKANYVFKQLGLDIGFIMVIGDPNNAGKIYEAFRNDPKYCGGGTGSGFKNRAPQFLDRLDPLAEQIGAINVVAKVGKELVGYNTDGLGFVRGLEELIRNKFGSESLPSGKFSNFHVLILGAGGTADAIAFTLANCGVGRIDILNRTASKAEVLAKRINIAFNRHIASGSGEELITQTVTKADIIINASTKGAEGPFKDFSAFAKAEESKLKENLKQGAEVVKTLKPKVIVCDINLRSDESPTLRLAREAGLIVQDGAPMNFHQAVEALWIIHHEDFKAIGVTKEEMAKLVAEAK